MDVTPESGTLPDADAYGDAGADTLGHLSEAVGGLRLPAPAGAQGTVGSDGGHFHGNFG